MPPLIFIGSYCALSSVIALVVQHYVRGLVRVMLLSPTVSAILLQVIAYLYLGHVDAWADIAFVTSWLIALACTLAIIVIARLWSTLRRKKIGSA